MSINLQKYLILNLFYFYFIYISFIAFIIYLIGFYFVYLLLVYFIFHYFLLLRTQSKYFQKWIVLKDIF